MRIIRLTCLAIISMVISIFPLQLRAIPLGFDTDIMLLLAGPVSEAVQETVLLVRRGDNFASKDSLSIGCVAGASAGLMVGLAPALGFVEAAVVGPPSASYLVGTMLLSCTMSMISSAAGMGTVWGLKKWREWRDSPPAPVLKRVIAGKNNRRQVTRFRSSRVMRKNTTRSMISQASLVGQTKTKKPVPNPNVPNPAQAVKLEAAKPAATVSPKVDNQPTQSAKTAK
ncbi:hypothetical protein TI04_03075 [Achromatium sp. WMS2]|nr:hypothetical protein TI04_03075 [Achromatium sp. WMS2]